MERERQLEIILENVPSCVALFDKQLICRWANPAYQQALGRSLTEIFNHQIFEFFPPGDCRQAFKQVLETGEPYAGREIPMRRPGQSEGATTYWNWTLAPVKDPEGGISSIVSTGVDVTREVKRRQRIDELMAQLSRSEEKYRALFQNMQSGFALCEVIFDDGKPADFKYVDVNAAFEKHTGLKPEAIIGKRVSEVIPGVHDEEIHPIELFGEVALTGQAIQLERYDKQFDHWFIAVIFRPQKNHFAMIFNDITQIKKLEGERKKHIEVLAQANEAKDFFFNILAHEMRTPLSAILNAVEVVKNSAASGEQKQQSLSVITRNVQHQSRLIDDLLEHSRIMRGKVALECDTIDLREVARAQMVNNLDEIQQKGLLIREELGASPTWVYGDTDRLGQVVNNLLTNAIKFTEAGGTITVRITTEEGNALLSVYDTGIGISPQLLPHLFDPYSQGEMKKSASSKAGLGLGLAIARSLAEQHGGELMASSEGEGRGSVFTLRLPIKIASEHVSVPLQTPAPSSNHQRILIVEDNDELRHMLHTLLELNGLTVYDASSGNEAIALAQQLVPDAALIDIGLPDIEGYQVAKALRAQERTRKLLLIALSGYASENHRKKSLAAGFDHHLAKPVGIEKLKQVLSSGGI